MTASDENLLVLTWQAQSITVREKTFIIKLLNFVTFSSTVKTTKGTSSLLLLFEFPFVD